MFNFSLSTIIKSADTFKEFTEETELNEQDLILTNEFIYEPFIRPCDINCQVIFQEKYGNGEPSDEMIDAIRKDIPKNIKRIIAVGGGTVIDIAKVLTFVGDWSTEDIFMGRVVPEKARGLIVIPTTCGTGSEVTNVTICELKNMETKKGLALNSMYADTAVLIPEMVHTLPYKFFATSSIDALIHAVESFVSPKAIAHSEAYSEKAMRLIVNGFQYVREHGADAWTDKANDFLIASNLAGIAFGYAGCAAVHALSYPLGGTYHIPHGEANQLMFAAVLKKYKEKQPIGKINSLEKILADILGVPQENALESLYELMEVILKRKDLKEYGVKEEELITFTDSVIEGQQRLLKNNYVYLTREEIIEIYKSCY
ncbi:MAG: 4-hydroxybutyrate dehydrogenase [Lachnospiraceae bacterium]|nr:4-hydroxybutyrate dehydrogenase [Lachnospiraceae bacterium]